MYNGKSITSDDWPRIAAIAKRTIVRLSLEFRYHSHIYRPTPLTNMARSSSEKLSRGTLTVYEDSTVPVEDEFADDDNAPIQSQDKKTEPNIPIESTVRTATVNDQPEIHSSKDPLPSQQDSNRERGPSPLADSTSASPAPEVSLLSHDFHVFTWLNLSTGSNLKRALKDLSKGG